MIRDRRWMRRLAGVPVVAWWTVGVAGAALAAWLVLLGFSGSVTTRTMTVAYGPTVSASAGGAGGNCTASRVGDLELALTWTDAVEASTCLVTASGTNTGTATVRLQRFKLGSAGFANGEVTATLGTACGLTLAPGETKPALVILEVTPASNPGTSITFDRLLDGYLWVPSWGYDPAGCS